MCQHRVTSICRCVWRSFRPRAQPKEADFNTFLRPGAKSAAQPGSSIATAETRTYAFTTHASLLPAMIGTTWTISMHQSWSPCKRWSEQGIIAGCYVYAKDTCE